MTIELDQQTKMRHRFLKGGFLQAYALLQHFETGKCTRTTLFLRYIIMKNYAEQALKTYPALHIILFNFTLYLYMYIGAFVLLELRNL